MLFQGLTLPVHQCVGFLGENQKLKERLRQRQLELSFLRSQLALSESQRSAVLFQSTKRRDISTSPPPYLTSVNVQIQTDKTSPSFVPSSTQKLTTKATADSEIQTDLVLTNNDKEQLIERLTMQCNLQKQLIEEQDLLLEQYQSIVNEPEPAVDLGADLEGLLHTVNDQSTAAAIRKQFETFKKRNEISQQLIDEYERLLNGR